MITIEQCRGARGILGWTQQDLADASGLSKTAINNFEKKHSDIKAESLRAIRLAFESADIEFIAQNGVAKKTENVRILRGSLALNDLIDDIHNTLDENSSEILISHIDASLPTRLSTQKLFSHIEFIKNNGIKSRIITSENTENILSPMDECRWAAMTIPGRNIVSFIYGSKVAFELWDKSMIIIVNSAAATKAETDRFEYLWAQSNASNTKDNKQKIAQNG